MVSNVLLVCFVQVIAGLQNFDAEKVAAVVIAAEKVFSNQHLGVDVSLKLLANTKVNHVELREAGIREVTKVMKC